MESLRCTPGMRGEREGVMFPGGVDEESQLMCALGEGGGARPCKGVDSGASKSNAANLPESLPHPRLPSASPVLTVTLRELHLPSDGSLASTQTVQK
ncbi:hypothetical protein Bpfe_020977 [Biomphalaria pfeifferi]|uniref:Uncharacterized protein n=1 Tax=Biomphalaria pfeifferi TaxID=112525 RepID=A0AAD8BA74_BIOPF|nr:hypothetical protein Bpfe_020977 [Biomphalaria pfeifferi]